MQARIERVYRLYVSFGDSEALTLSGNGLPSAEEIDKVSPALHHHFHRHRREDET